MSALLERFAPWGAARPTPPMLIAVAAAVSIGFWLLLADGPTWFTNAAHVATIVAVGAGWLVFMGFVGDKVKVEEMRQQAGIKGIVKWRVKRPIVLAIVATSALVLLWAEASVWVIGTVAATEAILLVSPLGVVPMWMVGAAFVFFVGGGVARDLWETFWWALPVVGDGDFAHVKLLVARIFHVGLFYVAGVYYSLSRASRL